MASDNCPWGDGRGNHVNGVSGCGCRKDPGASHPGAIDQVTGRCEECGGRIDAQKRDSGHRKNCKTYAAALAAGRGNRGRPPVKIPAHSGPWRKNGVVRSELDPTKLMTNWKCETCGRSTPGERGDGPPSNRCPEVRGR